MVDTSLVFNILAKDKTGGVLGKVGGGFQKALVPAGVALAALGAGAASSVKAYADAETQQKKLEEAYRRFPALADTNIESLRNLNQQLQAKTGYDDDETAAAQANLAQYGLTGQQIAKLTPLLQDYATKTGQDLPTAATALGKSFMGQGRALKGIGINFKDAGSVSENYAQVVDGLQGKVGGLATAMGDTAAGKVKILQSQFENLQENVGGVLTPVLKRLLDAGLNVTNWISNNTGKTTALVAVVGGLAAAVVTVNVGMKAYQATTAAVTAVTTAYRVAKQAAVMWTYSSTAGHLREAAAMVAQKAAVIGSTIATTAASMASKAWAAGQWLLNAALNANPIGLIVLLIAGLVAGIIYAWKNSETFRNVVLAVWGAIKGGVSAVVNWLKVAVPAVFAWIKNAFLRYTPYGIIISHWGMIKAGIGAAVGWIKGAIAWFGSLPGKFAGWFTRVKDAVNGRISAVVSNIKGLPGKILGALSGFGSLLAGKGRDLVEGLINGIRGMGGRLMSWIKQWVLDHIPGPIAKALGIASPSKVTAKLGRWTALGFAEGIEGATGAVRAAATSMATMPVGGIGVGVGASTGVGVRGGTLRASAPIVVQIGARELAYAQADFNVLVPGAA